MFEPMKIAPSILSADFMHMADDIAMIEEAGADFIHVDVMDGHFVPNLTIGVPFVKQLNKIAHIPLDVHLMISNPLVELPWFIDAGSDLLTVHYEAFEHPQTEIPEAIAQIKNAGILAALSLKPDTPVSVLEPFIADLDMVLMMSVYPGFSGQSYIEGTEEKIALTVDLARAAGVSPLIQVDGGIKESTVERVAFAGADICVMGSACFSADDPADAITTVRFLGDKGRLEGLSQANGSGIGGRA